MIPRAFARICAIVIAFGLFPVAVFFAQAATNCDRNLPVSKSDPLGYRDRNDRCEGLYIQKVSSQAPLLVASFGRIDLPERFTPGGALLVNWGVDASDVRFRAYSLKPRTYYRMDRRDPVKSHSYRWPTDMLAALKLTRRDFGIVAFTEQKPGNVVYLPVRIGNSSAGTRQTYELLLVPGEELKELYVGLWRISGGKRESVSPAKPLGYGFYPAGRSFAVPVGPIERAGMYLLELGATLRNGGSVSEEVRFVEAGGNGR